MITSVLFKLSKKPTFTLSYKALSDYFDNTHLPVSLENVAKAVHQIRKEKLPDLGAFGSAGSFFKNPIIPMRQYLELQKKYPKLISYPINDEFCKVSAGALIEYCGLKGHREGAVGIYAKQALVIINYGGASGKEVEDFSKFVRRSVFDHCGVRIESEVNII